jgi:hypothetical protein
MGIVKLRTKGFNQEGVTVIEFLRTIMVYRRGHQPKGFRPDLKDEGCKAYCGGSFLSVVFSVSQW